MIKILIADDLPSDGKTIEREVKRSVNNEIEIEFLHVNDLRFLKDKIEIFRPQLLLLDIKWSGNSDENNAGLNFIVKLDPRLSFFKLLFISGLSDADNRIRIAGLSGFNLLDKSEDSFPFIDFIKGISLTTEAERNTKLSSNLDKFNTLSTDPKNADFSVELYTNYNPKFDRSINLNDIVCIEGAGKYTRIYINKIKEDFYECTLNTKAFIEKKIRNRALFDHLFIEYGRKNNLFINKSFLLDQNNKNREKIIVKYIKLYDNQKELTIQKEFSVGYKK